MIRCLPSAAMPDARWQEGRSEMYATMLCCDPGVSATAAARERMARRLAATLAALPGFVAVVAIETDAAAGTMSVVYLAEERAGLAVAERAIAQWQQEQDATEGRGVLRVGEGEVIAQKGI